VHTLGTLKGLGGAGEVVHWGTPSASSSWPLSGLSCRRHPLQRSPAAAVPDNRERAEWPPHPARIFMALAATHFQTGADPSERAALCWLENLEDRDQRKAPAIVASDVTHRAAVVQYVPVNDDSGHSTAALQSAPLPRARQPRTFARAWLESDTVFLFWPEAEPDEAVRSALAALCSKVSRKVGLD
jgi:CRISPR-associated protein Csb2